MTFRFRICWLLGIVAFTVAMMGASPAQASTGQPLTVCLMAAKPALSAPALFRTPSQFDCTTPQSRYGAGDFWVLSQILPVAMTQTPDLRARVASVWQDKVTLYVLYADGAIRHTGFTSHTAGRHLRMGATFSQTLPPHPAPPVRLLWHVEGSANLRGVVLGAALATPAQAAESEILLAGLYASFGGMAIALIVYNLALWGALRQRFQPVYCLLVLCLLGYAFSSSAALGQLVPSLDNNIRLRINVGLLAVCASMVMIFARTFFERRVFDGWPRPASNVALGILASTSVAFAALAPWQIYWLDRLLTLSYLPLIVMVPPILYRAWRVRSNYLWMFALAWGVPIIFASLRIAGALGLMAWSFWIDNSTMISMMLEALLSSLAIAYRIRLLSVERDEAREQEIAARLLADTEPLTGLLNRRAFLNRAIGRQGDQMLLIADVDHFKRVNETIGHDGGDEVLRVVARALRNAVPPDALVARIGGEEFAILVDARTPILSDTILERLRSQRMPFDITVTASIGSCTGPLLRESDWKTLYRSADRALFAAKGAGRDRSRDAGGLPIAA
ncbi:diguanylate cyclase domain-containing protein [Sphingomonas sp. R86520]|uniref:GGDEF domain-containing protein n=1 Tax=Sphingomonas sp. R86520 TaxID=3093859 RepID=UPI0036D2C5AB